MYAIVVKNYGGHRYFLCGTTNSRCWYGKMKTLEIFLLLLAMSLTNAFGSSEPRPIASSKCVQGIELKPEMAALPESDPNDSDIPTIQFGETVRFEELGPIIINADGSTRRIDNWDTLTEREKEVTWRRIKKRNEERRKALLEKEKKAGNPNE